MPTAIVPRVAPAFANSDPEVEVSFAEIWRILRKRKRIIAGATIGDRKSVV